MCSGCGKSGHYKPTCPLTRRHAVGISGRKKAVTRWEVARAQEARIRSSARHRYTHRESVTVGDPLAYDKDVMARMEELGFAAPCYRSATRVGLEIDHNLREDTRRQKGVLLLRRCRFRTANTRSRVGVNYLSEQ